MLNKYLCNEWIDSFLLLISVHFNSHFVIFFFSLIYLESSFVARILISLIFFFSFSIFSTLWWSFFSNSFIYQYIMVFPFGILCYMLLCVCVVCLVTQSCLTLWGFMVSSPPSFSVHGIFQTRILERVAISYSQGSSWPRDWTHISCISCISIGFFTTKATILLALKQ